MKKIASLFALLLFVNIANAQLATRTSIVEHFTNSWCSVCFSNNGKLYTNLRANPNVLHISYFPSSPYSGCQINHFNATANDDRTNYYGVYGATPKIVIAGEQVLGTGSFTSASLFSTATGASVFSVKVSTTRSIQDSVKTKVVIRRVATGGVASAFIYGVITEDTLRFNANNGERIHYDVFRAPVIANNPVAINLPANVNDSIVLNYRLQGLSDWTKVSATIILQGADKKIIQVGRASTMPALPTGISGAKLLPESKFKWDGMQSVLRTKGILSPVKVVVYETNGRLIQQAQISDTQPLMLESVPKGNYVVIAPENGLKMLVNKTE